MLASWKSMQQILLIWDQQAELVEESVLPTEWLLLSRKAEPPTPPEFQIGDSSPRATKYDLLFPGQLHLILHPPLSEKETPTTGNILIPRSEARRNVNSMLFWTTAGAFLSIVIMKTQQTQNNSSTSPTVWNCRFLDPKLEQISRKNFYLRSHRSLEHTFRENIPIKNLTPAVLQQVPGTALHGTCDPRAYCYCSAGFFSLPAISVTCIFPLNISRPYFNHTWEIAW